MNSIDCKLYTFDHWTRIKMKIFDHSTHIKMKYMLIGRKLVLLPIVLNSK